MSFYHLNTSIRHTVALGDMFNNYHNHILQFILSCSHIHHPAAAEKTPQRIHYLAVSLKMTVRSLFFVQFFFSDFKLNACSTSLSSF